FVLGVIAWAVIRFFGVRLWVAVVIALFGFWLSHTPSRISRRKLRLHRPVVPSPRTWASVPARSPPWTSSESCSPRSWRRSPSRPFPWPSPPWFCARSSTVHTSTDQPPGRQQAAKHSAVDLGGLRENPITAVRWQKPPTYAKTPASAFPLVTGSL